MSYDFVAWRPHAEMSHFQELDVGLYPLDDTPWSRGECGFKARPYLACASLLSHGVARSLKGEAGHALVQVRYSVRWAAPRLAATLREAAA